MRVFVAGGTGVVGRRLVPQLVARGHQVTASTTSAAKLGLLEQLGAEAVVVDGELLRWTTAGYVERTPRPARARTTLITPPSLVEVLRAGWRPNVPLLHPSAAPENATG